MGPGGQFRSNGTDLPRPSLSLVGRVPQPGPSSASCVSPPGESVGNTCPVDSLRSAQIEMRDVERDAEALKKLKKTVVKYL